MPLGERVRVLDGGLATALEARGHRLDDPLWSARMLLDDPAALVAVHRDYAAAGADLVSTATYQASHDGLRARGLSRSSADALFARAATLVREGIAAALETSGKRRVEVVGSLGSYGASLADGAEYTASFAREPEGSLRRRLADFHGPRIEALAPHVDWLAFETLPSLVEVDVLRELVSKYRRADGSPVRGWLSVTLTDTPEPRLPDGSSLGELLVRPPDEAPTFGLGINCCAPTCLGRALASLPRGVVQVAYPNSGERWVPASETVPGHWRTVDGENPRRGQSGTDPFIAAAASWVAAGVSVVGGCCRTGPGHIARLAAMAHPTSPAASPV